MNLENARPKDKLLPKKGWIAIQDHVQEFWIRNIRIRELLWIRFISQLTGDVLNPQSRFLQQFGAVPKRERNGRLSDTRSLGDQFEGRVLRHFRRQTGKMTN